jgi:hypothetical protein
MEVERMRMMGSVRQQMFPYGMFKNPDGSWTFFNRSYNPVGVVKPGWYEWDDRRHKLVIGGLTKAVLKKLDVDGIGEGNQIWFYNDNCTPGRSSRGTAQYLAKLEILLGLKPATTGGLLGILKTL